MSNSEPHREQTTASPARKKPSWIKRTAIFFASLVLLIMVFVALLPTLISTKPGTDLALSLVNSQIEGVAKVDQLSLGWFQDTIAINQLQLDDLNGNDVAKINTIQLNNARLIDLALNGLKTVDLKITDGDIRIERLENGQLNLQEIFPTSEKQDDEPTLLPAINAEITDLRVTFAGADIPESTIDLEQLQLALVDGKLKTEAKAVASYEGHQGSVAINADLDNLLDEFGEITIDQVAGDLDIKLTQIPTPLAALWVGDLPLVELVGPHVNLTLNAAGENAKFDLSFDVQSQHTAAKGTLKFDEAGLSITTAPNLSTIITQQAWAALFTSTPPLQPVNDITLTAQVNGLTLPLNATGEPALDQLAAAIILDTSNLDFKLPTGERLQSPGIQIGLSTNQLVGPVKINSTNEIVFADTDGIQLASTIRVNSTIDNLFTSANKTSEPTSPIEATFEQATATTEIRLSELAAFPVLDQLIDSPIAMVELFGKTLNLNLTAETDLRGQGRYVINADALGMNAALVGRIEDQVLSLTDQCTLSIQFKSQQAAKALEPYNWIDFTKQPKLDLALAQTEINLANFNLATLVTGGTLMINQIHPGPKLHEAAPQLKEQAIAIDTARLTLPRTALGETLRPILRLPIQTSSSPIDLNLSLDVDLPLTEDQTDLQLGNTTLVAKAIPVDLLAAFANDSPQLEALLGEQLDRVEIKILEANANVGSASASDDRPSSNQLQARFAASVDDDEHELDIDFDGEITQSDKGLTLSIEPQTQVVQIEITQALIDDLTKEQTDTEQTDTNQAETNQTAQKQIPEPMTQRNPFRFVEPGQFSADINQAIFQVNENTPPTLQLDAVVNVPKATVTNDLQPAVTAHDAKLRVQTNDPTQLITVNFSSNISVAKPTETNSLNQADKIASKQSPLISNVRIQNLFNPEGKLTLDQMTVETNTSLEAIPMGLVDMLTDNQYFLHDTVGPTAALSIQGQYPGELVANIKSQNLAARVPLRADLDRVLQLTDDLTVDIKVNPQIAQLWLADISPILRDTVSSDDTVKLRIQQQGFRLPVTDFDISQVAMAGQLELGVMQLRSSGFLSTIVDNTINFIANTLNAQAQTDEDTPTFEVQFQPMAFTLQNGVMKIDETWLYGNGVAVGVEGDIDLANELIDYAIGIVGTTLLTESSFSLSRIIDPRNIYDVKLTGNLKQPKVDRELIAYYIAGSAVKNNIPVFGQIITDVVGKGEQRRVRAEKGIEWSVPTEVTQSVEAFINRPRGNQNTGEQQPENNTNSEDTPAETPAETEPENPIRDLLDLFGQ